MLRGARYDLCFTKCLSQWVCIVYHDLGLVHHLVLQRQDYAKHSDSRWKHIETRDYEQDWVWNSKGPYFDGSSWDSRSTNALCESRHDRKPSRYHVYQHHYPIRFILFLGSWWTINGHIRKGLRS